MRSNKLTFGKVEVTTVHDICFFERESTARLPTVLMAMSKCWKAFMIFALI